MNAADFDKLSDAEKEHFVQCPKCGQFVDKRELQDVIFHWTGHKLKPHISANDRETNSETPFPPLGSR
jgi:uncharacterized C2H2 Zn-finger protein